MTFRSRRGCDRMVVGFTTTYAISAYVVSSNSNYLFICLLDGV